MSSFTAMGVLFAFAVMTSYTIYFMDRLLWDRMNTIVTGIVRGGPASIEHPRSLFYWSWLVPAAGVVGYQTCIVIGWIVMAKIIVAEAVAEEVKLFAYLCIFFGAWGIVGMGYQVFFGYFRLASALRQAESN